MSGQDQVNRLRGWAGWPHVGIIQRLVGSLPGVLQLNIVYGAGVTSASHAAGQAAEFIQFLIEPESRKVWIACGFDSL